jgi:FkbM family methyltransferase
MASSEENTKWYAEEKHIFAAFKKAGFKPKVIFDIGSSHAGWSDAINGIFQDAEFHLFEPLVDYKPFYRKGCDWVFSRRPKLVLHKILLGNKREKVRMFSDSEGFSASVLPSDRIGNLTECIEFEMETLDAYIHQKGLALPEMLKMDVQGAELLVLEGGVEALRSVKLLQLEVWFIRGYGSATPLFDELIDYLSLRGFALFEIGERFYDQTHRLLSCDAFFAREDLLASLRGRLPEHFSQS